MSGFQGFLRQATSVDVLIGPFLDEDDQKTAESSLTITSSDVYLSKNGQGLAAKHDSTACAFDEGGPGGCYNCPLDSDDTDTCGQLTLIVHESGALPVRNDYQVITRAAYDAMFGSSAKGPTIHAAHTPSSVANVTGQQTGTYASAASRDGSYHLLTDEGDGIEIDYVFNDVAAEIIPVAVEITARYNGQSGTSINVSAYNYETSEWEQLNDSNTAFTHSSSDSTVRFDLDAAHREDGAAKLRFVSDTANSGDTLRFDQVRILSSTNEPPLKQAAIATAIEGLSAIVAAKTIADDWTDGGRLDLLLDAIPTTGTGSVSTTINVKVGGVAVDGAEVRITSDADGNTAVAGPKYTDASGNATFLLDPGTYYAWVQSAGYDFSNPTTVTVT